MRKFFTALLLGLFVSAVAIGCGGDDKGKKGKSGDGPPDANQKDDKGDKK